MIKNKQELNYYISEDAKVNGFTSKWKYYLKYIYGNERANVLRYLISLRKLEYYENTNAILKHYWRYRNRQLSLKYGIQIGINMVGPGLSIAHIAGGVIINCLTMGDHCRVSGGVVVGNKDSELEKATIGSNVQFTLGSKVFGKITIGDNVRVAPNSVVVKDVPNNCVVSGVPAKIIKQNGIKVV